MRWESAAFSRRVSHGQSTPNPQFVKHILKTSPRALHPSQPPLPQRSRTRARDGGATLESAAGNRGGGGGGGGAIDIKDLSEESFYRVAVENILAREGLSAHGGSITFGDGDDDGEDYDAEGGYHDGVQGGRSAGNSDGGGRRNVGRRPHGRRPKRSELSGKDAAVAALRSGGPRDRETGSAKLRRRRKKVIAFSVLVRKKIRGIARANDMSRFFRGLRL